MQELSTDAEGSEEPGYNSYQRRPRRPLVGPTLAITVLAVGAGHATHAALPRLPSTVLVSLACGLWGSRRTIVRL